MLRRSTFVTASAIMAVAISLPLGSSAAVPVATHTTDARGQASPCGAPVKPNGGQMPNDLTISPHSGPPTQVIHLHLSSALIASRQWNGFYILWDGTQQIEDGGGAPPQDLTFTSPDYNETGTVAYDSQGYHTVGVYDTYVNVATIEPQNDVASASFYITGGPVVCTTPSINQLQISQSVRGGGMLHIALTTDPHARVHVIVHVPATPASPAYTADIETPADSASGNFSLDMMVPVKPAHTVQATVTIIAHIGTNSLRQIASISVTP